MDSKRSSRAGTGWLTGAAALAIVGVTATVGYIVWQRHSAPPVQVKRVVAERGSIAEIASESGTVQFGDQQTLRSPAEGAVDQVLVQPGERVVVGQVLVLLRNTESGATTGSEVVKLKLVRLQNNIPTIQQDSQQTAITSPISGQVLEVMVQNGDGVDLRTELLTLGDPSEELVNLEISPQDAARVRLGQPARVGTSGPSSQEFEGRVVEISPLARSPEDDNGSETQATVTIRVRLAQPTRFLMPGNQVSVDIILESRDNVTVLDREAIQRDAGEPFVWTLSAQQRAQRRPVQIGLEGQAQVEVEAGVQPGEAVIVPPEDQPLEPGDTVSVVSD